MTHLDVGQKLKSQLFDAALQLWTDDRDVFSRSQESAKSLGAALVKVLEVAEHGEFKVWLKTNGIDRNRANYCVRLVKGKVASAKAKPKVVELKKGMRVRIRGKLFTISGIGSPDIVDDGDIQGPDYNVALFVVPEPEPTSAPSAKRNPKPPTAAVKRPSKAKFRSARNSPAARRARYRAARKAAKTHTVEIYKGSKQTRCGKPLEFPDFDALGAESKAIWECRENYERANKPFTGVLVESAPTCQTCSDARWKEKMSAGLCITEGCQSKPFGDYASCKPCMLARRPNFEQEDAEQRTLNAR